MSAIRAFLRRHAVVAYFVLTFAISWGGVLAVVGPDGFPGDAERIERLMPLAVLALLAGPSLSGILMTGIVEGRAGLRAFVSRLGRWRVGVRWYAVALLTAPVVMTAILLLLSLYSRDYLPNLITAEDRAALLAFGIPVGLSAGFFEELGWTGFATPALRRRHSVLATGLILGVLWAVWHLQFAYWLSGMARGPFALGSYLLDPFLFLVPFRILIVWVHEHTGSLLLAMLMHVSLTTSARVLSAPVVGVPLLVFDLVWAAVVWGLAAAVVARRRAL